LKDALERLGLGPCHHMYEIVEKPEQIPAWQALIKGGSRDMGGVFAGYASQVDWPGAHFWRQSLAAFPDAKVLHSVRPPEKWWASFDKTIGKLMERYTELDFPPHIVEILDMSRDFIGEQTLGGQFRDKEAVLAAFAKRTEEVVAAVPEDQLLVFDVAEGWEPLCDFLQVPVPDIPFPHLNLRGDFWEVLGGEPD